MVLLIRLLIKSNYIIYNMNYPLNLETLSLLKDLSYKYKYNKESKYEFTQDNPPNYLFTKHQSQPFTKILLKYKGIEISDNIKLDENIKKIVDETYKVMNDEQRQAFKNLKDAAMNYDDTKTRTYKEEGGQLAQYYFKNIEKSNITSAIEKMKSDIELASSAFNHFIGDIDNRYLEAVKKNEVDNKILADESIRLNKLNEELATSIKKLKWSNNTQKNEYEELNKQSNILKSQYDELHASLNKYKQDNIDMQRDKLVYAEQNIALKEQYNSVLLDYNKYKSSIEVMKTLIGSMESSKIDELTTSLGNISKSSNTLDSSLEDVKKLQNTISTLSASTESIENWLKSIDELNKVWEDKRGLDWAYNKLKEITDKSTLLSSLTGIGIPALVSLIIAYIAGIFTVKSDNDVKEKVTNAQLEKLKR